MSKNPAIISMEDFTESINMLVYGDSGVGKTVLAGTAPNALFLGIEDGTVSAKRQGSTADLWPIREWNDLQEAIDWIEDNPEEYEWIIIDTATQMQRLCMRGILDLAAAENKSRDPDVAQIQDWGTYYNRFQRFVASFNALPVNVLYLAHTMIKDDEDGETVVLPEIAGPSHSPLREAQAMCASMGVVAFYRLTSDSKADDSTVKRSLLFQALPPHFAKDRYDVFPRWVTVTKSEDGGKTTQQLTTMADIANRIENSPPKSTTKAPVKKAAPAKKAAVKKATPARRRPV